MTFGTSDSSNYNMIDPKGVHLQMNRETDDGNFNTDRDNEDDEELKVQPRPSGKTYGSMNRVNFGSLDKKFEKEEEEEALINKARS